MKTNGIKIKKIAVKSFISGFTGKTNCFVIWKKGLAVVIDPGGEGENISRFLKRNKLEVGAYWLTHGHPDHVGGLSKLLDDFPASVRYNRADSLWVKSSLPLISIIKRKWFRPFGAIRKITCADIVAKVILAPGHSPGGVCYWFDELDVLLSGDTIMRDYIGTTVWPGGNADKLKASIQKIYNKVPKDIKILPGHGNTTTIGREFC